MSRKLLYLLSSSPNGGVVDKIQKAAALQGVTIKVISLTEALNTDIDWSKSVILPRISPEENQLGVRVLQTLESRGATIINKASSWFDSRDKWRTVEVLDNSSVASPHTVQAVPGGMVPDIFTDQVVYKPLNGTHGNGIVLLRAGELIPNTPGVLQEYIEAEGKDVRVFVVGNKVVAAMQRKAKKGDFRSNLHQGGSAESFTINDDIARLALNASRAFNLEISGVDIIADQDGNYYVMEVNPSPGLGIQAVSNVDIATAIVNYMTYRASE